MASADLIAHLPFARRYARALIGSQSAGDAVVASAVVDRPQDLPTRLGLYASITRLAEQHQLGTRRHPLQPIERQLLLLTSLEQLSLADAARIVGLNEAAAAGCLRRARAALKTAPPADVLILEDEPGAATHMRILLEDCGHRVVGVTASDVEALQLVTEKGAELILADVDLAYGGNGIKTVRCILEIVQVPVIFVTANSELVLATGGLEAAFCIPKPFDPVTLTAVAYQAIAAPRGLLL
jgi:CheY-like chemotaxis protein